MSKNKHKSPVPAAQTAGVNIQKAPLNAGGQLLWAHKQTSQEIHIKQSDMPDEETLAAYARLIPGGADRLMSLIEKQAEHRMKLEALAVPAQIKQSGRGQIFGFVLAIVAFLLSAFFLYKGNPSWGGIIATSTAVSMAVIFAIGKHSQKVNLAKKQPAQPNERKTPQQIDKK